MNPIDEIPGWVELTFCLPLGREEQAPGEGDEEPVQTSNKQDPSGNAQGWEEITAGGKRARRRVPTEVSFEQKSE